MSPAKNTTHLKADIIVSLVSDRPAANITPVLDPQFRPDKIVLVQHQQSRQTARHLATTIKPTGVKVEFLDLNDPWNIEAIRNQLIDLLAKYEDKNLILNLSGGNKLLSIAAYDVFRAENKPIFYVHPEKDEIAWINPENQAAHAIADKIKLRAFLSAHGAKLEAIKTDSIDASHQKTTVDLVNKVSQLQGPLRALNWYAHQAERLVSPPLQDRHLRGNPEFDYLLSKFENNRFLSIENGRIVFAGEDERFYVNGGWLEEHVYAVINTLRKQVPMIQDVGRSVEITRGTGNPVVRNEIDVAFLANNKLYIIECKTKHFGRSNGQSGSGAEAIYKLDTLKDLLGGLHGQAMLVSYGELNRFDRQRAADLQVEICNGTDIQSLSSRIRQWIGG